MTAACPKCGGLQVEEIDVETAEKSARCLNCGRRGLVPTPLPQPFVEKRMIDEAAAIAPTPPPVAVCSVPGCKKPKAEGSVQCERHRNKQQRNNMKHRERVKMAMNGSTEGATWKSPVLLVLVEQRALTAARLAEIDKAITAIKGL